VRRINTLAVPFTDADGAVSTPAAPHALPEVAAPGLLLVGGLAAVSAVLARRRRPTAGGAPGTG